MAIPSYPQLPAASMPAHAAGAGEFAPWSFAPPLLLGLGLLALAYLWAWRRAPGDTRPRRPGQALAFLAGLVALGAAFGGPIEGYSDDSLAAHMVQHLILLQLAPPLLWLGRPITLAGERLPGLFTRRPASGSAGDGGSGLGRRAGRLAQRLAALPRSPWLVGLLFNLDLLLWHLPSAYTASLRSPAVHAAEHLSFLGLALAFWWLVLEPGARPEGRHAVYGLCFASCMAGMLVALALTFAPLALYPWYVGRGPLPWGLDPLADQRAGGLIMFAGGLVYLGLLFQLLAREAGAR